MKKLLQIISLTLVMLLSCANTLALTDPEPNPFTSLQVGEVTFTGQVSAVDSEILTVKDAAGKDFSGRFDSIYKYREGAGPAAANEFFIGDKVRVLADKDGVILAAQNTQLLLCNQNFYGYVSNPSATSFDLKTLDDNQTYKVNIGKTTRYRDENNKSLFGYTPRAGNILRIHGVVNTNVKQVFTETFGAYISLISQEAATSLVAQIQEAAASKIENEVKILRANPEFQDVSTDDGFFDAIQFVKREGVVDGYKDGSFQPENPINRAEFTKIIVNAKYASEVSEKLTESCFPDVTVDAWFAPFVCLAKTKGIIAGYPDGKFKPENPVNLAEAVTILSNTFGLEIPEAKTGEAWYQRYLAKTTELRITPLEFSDASAALTRGQMAELIMRATQNSRGKLASYLDYLKNNEE